MHFEDLPDEMLGLIIDHTQPGFDHRSRTLAQDKCRELLIAHEHDSLVTERLLSQLGCFPTDHIKYYTFIQELTKFLSPAQLLGIVNCSISDRIHQMAIIAQKNQDHALAKIALQITLIELGEDVAFRFRKQLQDQSINLNA